MLKDCKTYYHQPVLYRECMEALAVKPDGNYLDGTMGGAGHAAGILSQLGPKGHLVCLDRDQEAVRAGAARLAGVAGCARCDVFQAEYAAFDQLLASLAIRKWDGVLLDLGFSSAQVDQAERGFSYNRAGPLDMRMDQSCGPTAADLVNTATQAELFRIIRQYGEERYAGRIARSIVASRKKRLFSTTTELVDCIFAAVPAKARREKQHPAKRTFQALRIAVNDELGQLNRFLEKIPKFMNPGGRLLIITFHSLEDRPVKKAMRVWEDPCTCPPSLPVCMCGKTGKGKARPRKGVTAGAAELASNPRARSARLRIFEFKKVAESGE